MNTNSQGIYTENQLSKIILDAAFKVHTKTGSGLLINFGEVHLKNGIERIVNGLPENTPAGFGPKLLAFFASLAAFA
jgi:hypothetical protein